MTSGVPWQLKGVRREVIETAHEAARRSGMSVAEWLDSVISESATGAGVAPAERARSDFDEVSARSPRAQRRTYAAYGDRDRPDPLAELSDVSARLDILSRQLDHFAPAERNDRAAARPDRGEPSTAGFPDSREPPIDQALAEIEARQRALDGEAPGPRRELARAPTQRLPDLEQQLRELNARMDTMRPCGLDNAVETLRDDLAEIGVMLKDAMPRQAIEALETEVRSLASRIDDKRHAGADDAAIAGIERGLAEVRDALHGLTPAESLAGFDETVQRLSQKVDGLVGAAQDPAALKQLEGAIVALRGVVSHVASNDALTSLSEEVRSLSAKVDQVAGSDAFSVIEQRIASLTDALQSRSVGGPEPFNLDAVVAGLGEKFEQLHLNRGDHTAIAHLEDRIVRLVEKLDASDSRLSQIDAVERGLTDLLVHLEAQRSQAAHGAPQHSADADELRRDVLRTRDSLEAVHGTLGHVVDRLATIETTMRSSQLSRAAEFPAPDLVPEPDMSALPPLLSPQPAPTQPALSAASEPSVFAGAPPAVPAWAEHRAPIEQSTSPQPPLPAISVNPAPAHDRRPIDPDLPPDHPLEPGDARARSGGSSPSERIAASEAALGNAKPPVIPDPAGKSNFIAAARRAAQAALADAPAPKESKDKKVQSQPARSADPSLAGKFSGQMRKILVAAGIVLLVLGAVHFAMTKLWRSGNPPPDATAQTTPADSAPTVTKGEPAAQPPAMPDRRSAVLPFGGVTAPGSLPGAPVFGPPAVDLNLETTGTIATPAPALTTAPTPPLPPPAPAPARGSAADRLPAGIGSGSLRAAAAKGDAAAEFEIATRFAEGRGVPQNLSEAAAWFERAAGKGLIMAQFRLGGLYEKGLGVRKDLNTARRLYVSAAEAGHGKAMHNLAVLYAEGIDGRPDYQAAARWFRRAADYGVIDSQYNLAILYSRGIGVETNLAEAFKWFALASREGDREAARKRDEIAGRIDRQSLAAAMKAAQSWQAQPQPQAAIQVQVPAGGWDGVPAPSAAKRSVDPKSEAPGKAPAQ